MRDDFRRMAEEDAPPQKGVAIERLRAAWGRRKWLAILVFVIPFVAAVTIIFSLPPFYRSTALVLVEGQQVPEAFVPATVTSELETRLHTINEEILSRARLESLVNRFGLYPALRKHVQIEELVDRMRRDIRLELKVTPGREGYRSATTAFTLSYRGPDPQTVAQVTNTLASFYIEENLKVRERQATGTAEFLKVQLTGTRKRLDELESRVSDFRRRHLGELPQQMGTNLAMMDNLNQQLRLNSDNQTRVIERRDSITGLLAEAAASPQSGLAEPRGARLARLQQELAAARSRYTEQHPSVIRLKAEIAATEQEPAEPKPKGAGKTDMTGLPASPYVLRLREMLGGAESDLRVLKIEEQRLRADIAAYQQRLENTPKREQEYLEVSRDYDTTRELYASLSKRLEAAQLAESMEQRQKGEQFRILDPAVPSGLPAAPNRLKLLAMSLVLSLGLAGGALMLAEMLDTSFHSTDELRQFTIVPVLVRVPKIVTDADRQRGQRRFRLAAAGVVLGLIVVAGGSFLIAHGNEQLVQLIPGSGS